MTMRRKGKRGDKKGYRERLKTAKRRKFRTNSKGKGKERERKGQKSGSRLLQRTQHNIGI